MKTTIKNLFLTFCLLNSFYIFAGEGPNTMSYSPSNPTAGQSVTFSIPEGDVLECQLVKIAPDLVGNPSLLLTPTLNAGSYTASYIYPTSGTYRVGYDETYDIQNCPALRGKSGGNRAFEFFDFGPVGGPFLPATTGQIPGNTNLQSAPLVIAPAPNNSIPTMGEWGLIILALMSVIFGVIMLSQKKLVTANINE